MFQRFVLAIAVGTLATATGCLEPGSATPAPVPKEAVARAEFGKQKAESLGVPLVLRPEAVAPETDFDFGKMEPGTSGEHTFVIRNQGSMPLKLRQLDTSCKCTVSKLTSGEVLPGKEVEVKLEWNVGRKFAHYKQWAQIETNDPDNSVITFTVQGAVRQDIKFTPETLRFGDLFPGDSKQAQTMVYSDRLADFELLQALPTDADFNVDVTPASAEELAPVSGLKGYVVRITTPANLPSGPFQHLLRLHLKHAPTEAEPEIYELDLQGRVLGRISVVGEGIDTGGDITFGALSYGQGAIARLKLKIRDPEPEVAVRQISVQPDFVKVAVTPVKNARVSGLYDLVVEVPKSAPVCAHRGDAMGTLTIDFDHPRVKSLNLRLDFSVRTPRELR